MPAFDPAFALRLVVAVLPDLFGFSLLQQV